MKTGIIYISKHGTTEKVAKVIAEQLNCLAINLHTNKNINVEDFDRIIIGSSIHMGSVNKKIKNFCEINEKKLMTKSLGLFLCCAEKGKKANEQLEKAFSKELLVHAKSIGLMGFEYNFDKMNFFERTIIKKVTGEKESISQIDSESITKFVKTVKK